MKKNIIYSLIFSLAILVTSCELPDNVDPKYASEVSPDALFTQAEISLVDQVTDMNVNRNISRLLVQYQSEVTYTTESRYNFSDRQIPDAFSGNIYRLTLNNLKDLKAKIAEKALTPAYTSARQKNELAIANIWEIYAYQVLVDQFGNIPYSEALLGAENSRPAYDDAWTIYQDLLVRLDKAIADLDVDETAFGAADVLYEGDVTLWKKFAASMKLRFGLRLADVPAANSNKLVTEALATGVFVDESESAIFHHYGIAPYVSPYYQAFVLDARKDFCPTNTLVDMMNSLNDPRRYTWFTQYPEDDVFTGLPYGRSGSSSYSKYSHFADNIRIDPEYPTVLFDYIEIEFLLAEAAERNLGGVTDAALHYNTAILESMSYWGISDAAANAYLAQPSVAYATAPGDYKEKIGTQKWLGLFDRGVEAWAEWRRLDYPILSVPAGMTYADIPVRMPYPFNENKMNKTNYDAASSAIGGDNATTKLFWDKF
ncbi:MAG TPA: SusD/RagB family nutrient-binding outer membrane lipoprotein [Bacteroidales bacterium]|nr:SusD/RagB family nutrient-binding outer membrane lipoprotein [Bacteroidales bacterium]